MIVLIFLYDLLEEVYFVSLGTVGYDIYLHFVTLPNMFLHDTVYSADQGPLPLLLWQKHSCALRVARGGSNWGEFRNKGMKAVIISFDDNGAWCTQPPALSPLLKPYQILM